MCDGNIFLRIERDGRGTWRLRVSESLTNGNGDAAESASTHERVTCSFRMAR